MRLLGAMGLLAENPDTQQVLGQGEGGRWRCLRELGAARGRLSPAINPRSKGFQLYAVDAQVLVPMNIQDDPVPFGPAQENVRLKKKQSEEKQCVARRRHALRMIRYAQ